MDLIDNTTDLDLDINLDEIDTLYKECIKLENEEKKYRENQLKKIKKINFCINKVTNIFTKNKPYDIKFFRILNKKNNIDFIFIVCFMYINYINNINNLFLLSINTNIVFLVSYQFISSTCFYIYNK